MVDFNSVLNDLRQLSEEDQLRLFEELWSPQDDADAPLDDELKAKLERRSAEIHAGTAKLIPWETVREESLRRIGLTDDR